MAGNTPMKLDRSWQLKSIEALEKRGYGDPTTAPTPLVRKCLEYVKLPVSELSVEQLRLLIGQEIGLSYLIPLALTVLETNIVAEGDMYPGDLLKNVTVVNASFWKNTPEQYARLVALMKKGKRRLGQYELKVSIPDISNPSPPKNS